MISVQEQILQSWDYQSEKALIVPYTPKNSFYFPEDFLVQLYIVSKKQGILSRAFPGGDDMSMGWFTSFFYGRSMLIGMEKPGKVAGFAWIYGVEGDDRFRKGSVGVCFFKEYWASPLIHELARLGLYWYFKEAKLDAIFGTVAVHNRVSVKFGKKMGFKHVGRIPMFFLKGGLAFDSDVLLLKRKDFIGEDDAR